MPRRTPLPQPIRDRPFSVAEAEHRGVPPGRLRGRDLDAPFSGVRLRKGSTGLPEPWASFAVRMPPRQFYSHVTAARIHGLPLPRRLSDNATLDVMVEIPHQCPRMPGVRGHRTKAGSVAVGTHDGFRVASPVDTWRQLSTVLSLDDLVAVGDALVRRKEPFATMAQLRKAVIRHERHRGARNLREAFDLVRPGVDSPRETTLRLILVRGGLPEPEVNGILLGAKGTKIATGDLVYRQHKVLVEYDGEQHRTDPEQYTWDIERLDRIRAEGWHVIRINKTHLRGSTSRIVSKVENALRAAGWSPTPLS